MGIGDKSAFPMPGSEICGMTIRHYTAIHLMGCIAGGASGTNAATHMIEAKDICADVAVQLTDALLNRLVTDPPTKPKGLAE